MADKISVERANILELLLGADTEKFKAPTKEVEITRLSEAFGSKFVLTCKAVNPDKYEEIQEQSVKIKGKDVDIDMNELQIFTVIEGVVDDSGKLLFKNKDLQKKFGVPTPKELVRKMLLSGEITALYGVISDLSGFGDGAVAEVKNS